MKKLFPILLILAAAPTASAIPIKEEAHRIGRDSLRFDIGLTGAVGTKNALQPLWSYSQEWGRYDQFSQYQADLYAKASYHWENKAGWLNVNAGAAVKADTYWNMAMLHEAYISGNAWIFNYTLGREAYTPIDQRDDLGMGTYLMSDNARPFWKAGAGIFDYWGIPGTRNWLEIKGGLYFGWLTDEGNPYFTDKVLYHEKFAYVRIGHLPVKPYLGLIHSVMMGGTLPNGDVMPIDLIASFLAKGSAKLQAAGYDGEYFNAAGGHHGMWELGLDMDFPGIAGSVYYQRPFVDNTAMNLFNFAKCKDILLGMNLKFKNFRYVRQVCLEYMTTMWQGGNGPRDPMIRSTGPEKNGELVFICVNDVSPDAVHKYVSATEIADWESRNGTVNSWETAFALITEIMFKGRGNRPDGTPWTWGNRSRYYENDYYPQGWTVRGLPMGYPLFLTDSMMSSIAPGYDFPSRFANVRMQAFSLGISGSITDELDYRLKLAGTRNYGNLSNQYGDGYYFDVLTPNYYFNTPKTEFYSGLWLNLHLGLYTFSAALTGDFGEMYNAAGLRFGVNISF